MGMYKSQVEHSERKEEVMTEGLVAIIPMKCSQLQDGLGVAMIHVDYSPNSPKKGIMPHFFIL